MFTKMILKTAIFLGLILMVQQNCSAQHTKDEIKAEREMLKAELKSKETEIRNAKIEKLAEPKISGISSIDELALNSTKMLISSKEINILIPEMYKRTIGESVDGVTDITVKKPSLEEIGSLGLTILQQIKTVASMAAIITAASTDLKSASFTQMPKAAKSLNFSKDVISLVLPELNLNLKVVNNLIGTLKSSGNY